MSYPEGAIKSIEELHDCGTVYGASKYFHMVDEAASALGLSLAHIYDYNVPRLNGYNDWFLFADEAKAKAHAGVKS